MIIVIYLTLLVSMMAGDDEPSATRFRKMSDNRAFKEFCICMRGKLTKKDYHRIHKELNNLKPTKKNKLVRKWRIPKPDIPFDSHFLSGYWSFEEKNIHVDLHIDIHEDSTKIKEFMKKIDKLDDDWVKKLKHDLDNNPLYLTGEKGASFFIKIGIYNYNIDEAKMSKLEGINDFDHLDKIIAWFKNSKTLPKGFVCSKFIFSMDKYLLAHNLDIPTDFYLPSEISEKMGKPKLIGLTFGFDDSKKGIEAASLDYDQTKEEYLICLKIKYDADNLDAFVKNNLLISYENAITFIQEREE